MSGVRNEGHVWVDGELLPSTERHLSAFDRGFQLGDGIFETLRASGGRPTELPSTWPDCIDPRRALISACPPTSTTAWQTASTTLLAADGLDGPDGDASIRITVSRGAYRARGVLPPDEVVPATVVIQAWPVVPAPDAHLERGLHLVASAVRRDPQSPLATLKTTSRAEYVYARLEARRAGADDALFLTVDDHLSEGTSANIFLVRSAGGEGLQLATPVARLRDPAGHDAIVAARLGRAGRPAAVRGRAHAGRPRRRPARRSCRRAWPGSCR